MSDTKVAIITGAARGIGLATALKFLDEGWRVALLDRNRETLTQAMEDIGQRNGAMPIFADVSDPEQVCRAIEETETAFGRLDALVNNAGIANFKPVLETSFEEWSEIMATNLNGPFLCTNAAAPVMLKTGGGAVVNIASISGFRASTLRVAYWTSKAGVLHLTKQQAAELGNLGIRVNAVCPGPVDTAMAMKVHTPEIRADYHANIPLNRYGLETEIAEAIFFLCSEKASYVNGQYLAVDGGFEATGIGLTSLRQDL